MVVGALPMHDTASFLFTISNSPVSSFPARFASGFFSFLFTFVAATPD
jgi:hypothetical protein